MPASKPMHIKLDVHYRELLAQLKEKTSLGASAVVRLALRRLGDVHGIDIDDLIAAAPAAPPPKNLKKSTKSC